MKKIISIIMLVATAIGIQAKDLNKEQMAIRLDVVKYLSKEGFQPKIDTDGDVKFVKDDRTYYTIIDENWNEPYLLSSYIALIIHILLELIYFARMLKYSPTPFID